MAEFELDRDWLLLYPIFALGTAASLGLVQTDILPFVNLSDTFYTVANAEFTVGRIFSIAALIGVFVTRDSDVFDRVGGVELFVLYATIGLIIAPPFFPVFQETLAEGPAGVVAFLVQSIGYTIVTYLN